VHGPGRCTSSGRRAAPPRAEKLRLIMRSTYCGEGKHSQSESCIPLMLYQQYALASVRLGASNRSSPDFL
jgi:hypothetical protein